MRKKKDGIRHLREDEKIWDIIDESGESVLDEPHPGVMLRNVFLKYDQSYMWQFEVELDAGVYHLRVDIDKEGRELLRQPPIDADHNDSKASSKIGRELNRRIQVLPPEPSKLANLEAERQISQTSARFI